MPILPRKPRVNDPYLQKWIDHVHDFIKTQPNRQISAPGAPSNLRVNPGPGQNHLTFTGGRGATGHIILASPTPTWDPTTPGSSIFDIGQSTEFPHVTGRANVAHFYWVVATRDGLKSDPPVGPVSGTTLALNVALTPTLATKSQPGNIALDESTKLPTVTLPGLTRGGRST